MAGLNATTTYGRDHIDPTIKDIGEQLFDDKIESIFKDVAQDKKIEQIKSKTSDRRRHTTKPGGKIVQVFQN